MFLRLAYLHHETTQCFVKQSRDFVVLVSERVEVSTKISGRLASLFMT